MTDEWAMKDLGVQARRRCGCVQCQGGYQIGQATIAMRAGDGRPTSCLAQVFLRELLSQERRRRLDEPEPSGVEHELSGMGSQDMLSPLGDAEIETLLGSTLHGPLPNHTMSRVFATIGEVPKLRAFRARHLRPPDICKSCGEDRNELLPGDHDTVDCAECVAFAKGLLEKDGFADFVGAGRDRRT